MSYEFLNHFAIEDEHETLLLNIIEKYSDPDYDSELDEIEKRALGSMLIQIGKFNQKYQTFNACFSGDRLLTETELAEIRE